MLSQRMLPFLWLRLIVVIGFTAFVAYQGMWLIALIGLGLTALTGYQIYSALRFRGSHHKSEDPR
ncbi:hypothetical protein P4N68_00130 [Corynebacterium felinum]|uniref:Secreted protein n=1 Tax=Corynebacterium felinum TaxID=131318 RepID=A0ABU2BAJ3_9CORY|nr:MULTISPECIES: hypothetical protein [Corynebacterium]MDF5819491.1 hypothetical protein [Corynebacterium felinum]MDO4761726.1 hypothetical protein [Corynebacterium sp.]MDR7355623.1 hypothetical protein [Corynebacterium felinum]